MWLLPELVDLVWIFLLFLTFGGVVLIRELRTKHGIVFAGVFTVFVIVVGLIWWDENIEWYQTHKDELSSFYNLLVLDTGLLPGFDGSATSAEKITVVTAFYDDLARADGVSAANLVVPEKRTEGPLSARALSAFFGSLERPLRLQTVEPAYDGAIRATYSYQQFAEGSLCDGRVSVDLTNRAGAWLIRAIHANC